MKQKKRPDIKRFKSTRKGNHKSNISTDATVIKPTSAKPKEELPDVKEETVATQKETETASNKENQKKDTRISSTPELTAERIAYDKSKETPASIAEKVKSFFQTKPSKKQIIIISVAGVFLLGGAGLLFGVLGSKKPEPTLEPIVKQEVVVEPVTPVTEASKLTGVQVTAELNSRPITGIMIENSIDARPQAGLVDAGVVFEAIAEGGITRFLALFQIGQPDYVGPIRSARPYYVQWAAGFDAAYAHSGGSGEALALIRSLGVKDMDHGNYPGYFDRVSNRYAPHNVYTSMARLDSLKDVNGFKSSTFDPFERIEKIDEKEIEKEATEEATTKTSEKANNINFNISSPLYNTSYTYDKDTNTYARVMAGQKHYDEKSGNQIKPTVVIAMVTIQGFHPDGIHTTYKTTGSGDVIIFQNGEVIKGNWTKSSDKSSLKFTTESGDPLELEPGQTWITAIPAGRVSYSP